MSQYSGVPQCLKALRQWVCWSYDHRGEGKPTKVLKTIGGHSAKSTDPADWYSFDDVCAASHKFDGIGFVFAPDDPYIGIDVDNCFDSPGEVADWASPILDRLDGTYGEISPSGGGVKFICRARNPLGSGRNVAVGSGRLEMYSQGRFFTITGTVWDDADPTDKQEAVDWLAATYMPAKHIPAPRVPGTASLSPVNVVERARKYLATMDPAISGSGGHNACFNAACKMVHGFDLDTETAYSLLANGYNHRCHPEWSERELRHKVDSAAKLPGPRGYLLTDPVHQETDLSGVDLSGIVGKLTGAAVIVREPDRELPPQYSAPPLPKSCQRPPGIIADLIDYTLATSIYPQPELALAAAISLVATITGRKLTDDFGTRTNVYILGLAPSGSGKEHARDVNKSLLLEAGGEKMIGPERIGSSAGLVSSIAEQPSLLLQLDEIGRLLATLKSPGKAAHLYNIATVLMQIYGCSGSMWIGDAYADTSRTKRVNQPHAVIYGTSVQESFWGSLSAENVTDGLLGRLMAFESCAGYVYPENKESMPIPRGLVSDVKWWVDFQPGGNLNSENPTPLVAKFTEEARERFVAHMRQIADRRKEDDATVAAIWSRSAGKAGKLGLIFAASRARRGESLTIELEDIDRGIALGNHLTRRTLQQVAEHVSDNEQEARAKRVLRLLDRPMTRSQICRKTQWLRGRERQEILDGLLEAGLIELQPDEPSGGRPAIRYFRPKP